MNTKLLINRNIVWYSLSLVLFILVMLTGTAFDFVKASILAAYSGLFFLVLTLLPSNILKLSPPFKPFFVFLTKYRRDFGITSGLMIGLHVLLSVIRYEGLTFEFLFSKPIFFGLLADIVFVSLLLTSSLLSMKALGTNWKRLHGLIWIIPTLVIIHALVASNLYIKGTPLIGLFFLGLIIAFSFIEMIVLLVRKQKLSICLKHFGMVLIGTAIGLTAYFLWPEKTKSSLEVSATITKAELKKHNTKSSCYIAYKGKVYNISSFIPEHPGGANKATQQCGQVTDTFSQFHSGGSFESKEVQDALKNLYIGELGD